MVLCIGICISSFFKSFHMAMKCHSNRLSNNLLFLFILLDFTLFSGGDSTYLQNKRVL